jgi:hypothetical protein
MNTVLLMGPPGSGKTTMGALTSPNKPVHIFDLDRKVDVMYGLKIAIAKGDVSYDELKVPLVEEGLAKRVELLSKRTPDAKAPMGWIELDRMLSNIKKNELAQKANTWMFDSWTIASAHLERVVSFHSGKIAFTFTEWGAFLKMNQEAISIIIDEAKSMGKDVIFTVHEREIEVPGPETKVIYSPGKDGNKTREYIGSLTLATAASIAGQFGQQIASHFGEVYALRVEVRNNVPTWICRVKPDGKRPLRTSYPTDKEEFPCDFTEIWSLKPRALPPPPPRR